MVGILAKLIPFAIRWLYRKEQYYQKIDFKVGSNGIEIVNNKTGVSAHFEVINHLPFPVSIDRVKVLFNLSGIVETALEIMPWEVGANSNLYFPISHQLSEGKQLLLDKAGKLEDNDISVEIFVTSKVRNVRLHKHIGRVRNIRIN